MIWPAMLFNLCVGLLFAAYLLRAVRRFERRADAIMARLDEEHKSLMAKYDEADAESRRKFSATCEEIIASMRGKADRAVAETQAAIKRIGSQLPPIAGSGNIVLGAVTMTATGTVTPPPADRLPTEQEIAALPRWAQVAFAARCARRVLPVFKYAWPAAPSPDMDRLENAVERAETADTNSLAAAEEAHAVGLDATDAVDSNAADERAVAVAAIIEIAAAGSVRAIMKSPGVTDHATDSVRHAARVLGTVDHIREDFEAIRAFASASDLTIEEPISPTVFGPLWPEGRPEGWPDPERAAGIVITFDIPDDMTTADAVALAEELAAALCALDLAGGGHGVAIQPPLEITAPARVPAGSSI
jgi:hypothetical protein